MKGEGERGPREESSEEADADSSSHLVDRWRLGFAVRLWRRLGRKGKNATSVHEGNGKGWKKKFGGLEAPDSD